MRVLHCCLTFEYVDDCAYQENILPQMHSLLGHDVIVLTATIVDRDGMERYDLPEGNYTLKNGVKIIRLKAAGLPYAIEKKIRVLRNVYKTIDHIKPDIIFIHEVNSLSLLQVAKYLKNNKHVIAFADNHNDYFNSGRSWLSLNILHKVLYRYICKRLLPFTVKFWGTLPIRCDFLRDIYGVPDSKIDFLPMGIDDTNIPYKDADEIRNEIRKQYAIENDTLLVVTGGKIDNDKHIVEVIQAVESLRTNIKILVFGKPTTSFESYFESIIDSCHQLIYVGWVKSDEVYKYFFAGDLACFPGGHSVLWEQAVACGIPSVFMKREGMNHVDLGGNCNFIEKPGIDDIRDTIYNLYYDRDKLNLMRSVALNKGRSTFSYLEIAKKAISPNIDEGGKIDYEA